MDGEKWGREGWGKVGEGGMGEKWGRWGWREVGWEREMGGEVGKMGVPERPVPSSNGCHRGSHH